MIVKSIKIEKFRAFKHATFSLGKRITAISGRNATQKTTLLGLIGQPFTISKGHPMYGCKTIDGYNFRSQFKEKFKISPEHDIIGQHKWKLVLHCIMAFMSKIITLLRVSPVGNLVRHQLLGFGTPKVGLEVQAIYNFQSIF